MKTLVSQLWLILFSLVLLSGPVARAQSPGPGSALNLDGASGYAQAANGVYFNGNFTVEAWVFVRSYNNWSRLIDFANGPDNNNVLFALSAGTSGFPLLGVYTSGGPQLQANTQLPTNQWVHLAATLNGTTGTIYINGNPVGNGTLNVPANVVRTINYIGRSNYGGDGYANALFDEIRIWNLAKTQTQILANMHRSLTGGEGGLVSYWRADEGTGAALTDSSGHGQTATVFGGTSWTNSTVQLVTGAGSALSFNAATGQSVSIPHQVALNAYPLTVMTWFMAPTNSNGGALVNKYVSSSRNGYQIFIAGDLKAWYFRDTANNVFNNGVMDAGPVNDGLWHHAAMTIDASGGRLYLDGVLKSSVTWSGTAGATTSTQPVSLGLYPGDSFLTGRIDDVSIWNTSLSAAQIQAAMSHPLAGTESGLIGYWRLDEGSGTNTVDSSGYGNNGTLQGGPAWISSGATEVAPDPAYALDLNGTDSYIQIPNGVWFTNDFTVEGWVFCRSYNSWSRLFDFGNAGYLQEVYMALSDGTTGFPKMGIFTNGNNNLVGSSQQLPLNQWTHLATTLSGSTATIYINGNAVGSGTVLMPGNFVRTNNYIGRSLFGGDAYANATFDEIRIWNVARSQSQIQQKMNSPLTGFETNLIGYWRFDEGSGTNSIDATGNGNNALLSGTASRPTWLFSRASVTNSATMQLITLPPTALTISSATLNGLVNPLGRAAGGWFQWGTTISYGSSTPVVLLGNGITNVPTSSGLTGLTPGTTYHCRVVATNNAGTNFGLDTCFTTPAGAPLVTTLSVSNISSTSATLTASVNPVGAATTVYFLYGPTTSYGATNIAGSAGSGLSPVIISSTLSNLIPATTYHFLVVASNSVAVTAGTDSTFQTPAGAPLVTAPSITNLSANAATLSASVNPGGTATTVYFLYGTTTNYGATDIVPNIGSGSTPLIISDDLSNLAANTVYHFLVTASNSLGTASTTDSTFQTYGPPAVTTLPASGVRATRAILNAAANPNGFDSAVYFQYGLTPTFGSATLVTNLTAGTNSVAIAFSVTGLSPASTYYYRVVGSNSVGPANGSSLTFATPAYSATNVVTTLNDGGPGSLRQAIIDANASSGNAIIDASGLTGVIGLTNSLPILTNGMTIQGSGPGTLSISGSNLFRIFFVDVPGDAVIVSNLTIANGMAQGGAGGGHAGGGAGMGGGLFVNAGDVTVANVIFSGNAAVGGAGGLGGDSTLAGGGGGGLGGHGGNGNNVQGNLGGGGGGGYAGSGGNGSEAGGGGGGISGNGGNGGVSGGGGGGGTSAGGNGGNPNGGPGVGGGGNGGAYQQNGNAGGFGGGGGGGGYSTYFGQGVGGAGGKFGGGGGSTDYGGSGAGGGAGGDFGGGGGTCGFNGGYPGGLGGFGGGGGGAGDQSNIGGNGGFGGGGGGGGFYGDQGYGGPFGGNGGNIYYGGGGGGGGGALGGAVFVRAVNGASLTVVNSSTDAGSVTGGAAGPGGTLNSSYSDRYPTGGGATGSSFFLLGGLNVFTVTQGTNVIAGDVGGWGGAPATVIKDGAGTLVLAANSAYAGGTFVNGGTLEVDGSLLANDLTLNSGGILSGTGSVATVTCASGGTLNPGVAIGVLNAAGSVWTGAGNYNWQMYDALGAAGVGFDVLNINGTLDVSNARGFNINLATLSSISPPMNGSALNFSSVGTSNSWELVQTTGGIIGFNATNFNLNLGPTNGTAGFFNSLVGGELTLSVDGNNLLLTYTHFAPGVATAFATANTPASVTLNGQVNPNGTSSAGWFQYGPTTNYATTTAPLSMGSGSVALPLSQNIGSLPAGALYHFRVVGSNSFGTAFGDDFLLGIPQTVTQPATSVLAGRAILNGNVNPGGLPTTAYFQYGLTTNYGTTTATTNLPAGNLFQAISMPLAGLSPATTYYCRVVAANSFGQATGASQSFTTGARASTWVVNNLNDSGPGSLRQALFDANATSGEGLVDATSVTGVIALASSLPIVTNSMTVQGSGATNLSISGNNQVRIFFVDVPHGELSINNITLQNGRARGGKGGNRGGGGAGMGGALFVDAGDVTVSGVAFSGNAAIGGNGGVAGGYVESGGGGGLGGNGGNGGDSSGNPAGGGGGGYGGNGGDGIMGGGGGGGVSGNGGVGSDNGAGGGGGGKVAGQAGIDATGGLGGGSGGKGGDQNQNGQPGGFYGGGGGSGYEWDGFGTGAFGGVGGTYGGGGGGSSSQYGGQISGYGGGLGGDFGGGGGACGYTGPHPTPGAGGFGGGGGGGGSAFTFAMYVPGAAGGFGGGSGGSGTFSVPTGPFGGQGGHILSGGGGGGGGAALGGAIFVRAANGASLTFVDISADSGSLTAGLGGTGLPLNPANGDVAAQPGQTAGSAMFLFGGNYVFTVNQPVSTITGDISGWSGALITVNKNGPGKLVLSAMNSWSWTTLVSAGTLQVDGIVSGSVTVNNGATLSGIGTVGPTTVNAGGTLSPGSAIGVLHAGANVWVGAGNYNWELHDATGAPGVGGDLLSINGTLDLSSASGFNINVASFPAGAQPVNFTNPAGYSWILVQTTDGIIGFNPTNFIINPNPVNGTAGFANPFGTGSFTLSVAGNNLVLTFQPSPPSVTTLAADQLGTKAAALHAMVNPNGTPAFAWFQYGVDTNYGSFTATSAVGSGTNSLFISQAITALASSVYHFQVVASNAAGTAFGNDMSFSVAPFTNVASSLPPVYFGSIAWGDFNNDGLLDLLVTGATNGSVSDGISQVWQNLGNGSFSNIDVNLPGVSESSVAWGDFDNDGFLDVLLTGYDRFGNALSQVWHNNGDGTFSLTSASLPGVGSSSVALADFDNDGRLDILLTGSSSSGLISQVWRNQGDGTFANMNVPLPGVSEGSVACSDYDKDGNVDILITGVGASGRLTQLWRNNGDGTFFQVNAGLPAARDGSVAWADFDGDGFPDILLSGGIVVQVWHNNHDGTFSNLNLDLPFLGYTSAAVGDFDNDGLPDIVLSGSSDSTGPGALTQLWRNLGNGSFTNVAVDLPGAWLGSMAWADFDNDGRLDFLMTGWDTNNNPMTLLLQNLNTQTNNPPAAPTGIAAAAKSSGVSLSWTLGSDAQTPAPGLTYNVRVGTNPGGSQILSAESGADGFRRVAQAGNAGQRLSTTLRGLTVGTTYYWSVQSVDSGFAGSAFSAEGTFIVGAPGVVTGPSLIASATSQQLTGSVNPNGSDSGSWFQWGTTTNYGNETDPYLITADNPGFIPVTNLVTGLTPGTVYHYRLVGTNAVGTSFGADSTFTVPLAPGVTTLAATAVVPTSALLDGTVLPNNAPTLAWFQWGTSTSYGATSAPISLSMTNQSAVALSNLLTSLNPSTQYHFLLSASNIAGIGSGGDMPFTTPAPSAPSVTSLSADGITPNRATLRGTAAPNGAATAAWFQWGTTPAYGNNTALFAVGASNLSALAVSNSLSGLAAGTVYYYRLAATNSAGTNFGGGLSLTTLPVTAPTATTLVASAVTASSATLNGSVNPNGADTLAWFQYGTNTSYGSVTLGILVSSNLSAAASLSNSVSGVVAGVVYHFQLVASNSAGISLGGDLTFLPPLFTSTQSGLPNLLYSSAAWGDFDNDGYLDVLLSGFDGTNVVAQVWRSLGNGSFSNMNVGLPGLYAGAVAWNDYDNDGYLDVLLMGVDVGQNPATQLWHNNRNGTFTRNTNAVLPGLYFGAVAWGDYDNDGKPDLLLSGADASSAPVTQLWHNDGGGSFSLNTNTPLPQVFASGVAWGDYDKDGRLDLLLSGLTSGAPVSQVWHNDGSGVFSLNTNAALPALYFSSVAWGDYDDDGRLDILLTGNNGTSPVSQVWHNAGSGAFTLSSGAVLPGTYQGSATWGDYDSDGKLDILLSGLDTSDNPLTQIWRNNGNGTFSAVNVVMPGVFAGTAIWGEVGNDGELDLLLTGASTNNSGGPDAPITALFGNVGTASNAPPAAPSGLAATIQSSSQVLLSWNAASDSQTDTPGLNYNLRIGTTPGGTDVLAPAAGLANGLRRLPQIGNAQETLSNIVTHLAPGTYYWSVQAIDTSFAGGPFAAESTFSIISSPPVITSFAYVAGQFQVRFNGQAGGSYTLQASTDLLQWIGITNLTVPTNGTYQVQDSAASTFQRRFYRLNLH